jgi:hypothetical protein
MFNIIVVIGGLPSVITVLGGPINKILGPDGLRSFLFAIPCKHSFAGTANKKSLPAGAGKDFIEVSGGCNVIAFFI